MASNDNAVVTAPAPPAVPAAVAGRFSSRRAYAQTFAATTAIRLLGVVSGVLAARLLGPTGRGELAVIVFLPTMLVPLGELELPRSLAYEVSRASEVQQKVIATGFWLALLLGCIQAVCFAFILPSYLPADKLHLLAPSRWFMLYLPATLITATLLGSDQGRGMFGRFSALLALPGLLYVAAILVVWAAGIVSPPVFAASVLVGVLIVAVLRIQMDWGTISSTLPNWPTAKRLLMRGLSFYFPAMTSFVLSRADMLILVRIAPTEAIGLYAVAQAIALGQIGAVNPFIQVGFSAVAGETEQPDALNVLTEHFRLAQIVVISVGLLTIALTPGLVRLMFGPKFTAAIPATCFLVGATMTWGVEQVLEQGLRAAGHPRPGIMSNLLGLVVLVGVGVPACLHYGILGIASAAFAAQLINLGALLAFCIFVLRIPAGTLWFWNASTYQEVRKLVKTVILRRFKSNGGA
jgi:enterobacterial common antigen flippase